MNRAIGAADLFNPERIQRPDRGIRSYAVGLVLKSEDALAPVVQGIAFAVARGRCGSSAVQRRLGNPEILIGGSITTVGANVAVWIASRAFSRANA